MTVSPYQSSPAPEFSLVDSEGVRRTLADYRGKWLVLYFYPADDTPGCTTVACSMRDVRDELADLGAEIVGISRDDPASHERFKQKYSLNFTLLCDPDVTTHKAYGAWGKNMFGKEGVARKTFLIDTDGIIRKIYEHVTPDGHGQELLNDFRNLKS